METFLHLIGSIASIGSIPLTIYIYLRSLDKRRKDFIKSLFYQIVDGKKFSFFEIQSIINSKKRGADVRLMLSPDDVIEDLVTETISTSMLNSDQKKYILLNLMEIHSKGKIFKTINDYEISPLEFLSAIQEVRKLSPQDAKLLEKPDINMKNNLHSKETGISIINSELFILIMAIFSIWALVLIAYNQINPIWNWPKKQNIYFLLIFLGMSISTVAIGLGFLLSKIKIKFRSSRFKRYKKVSSSKSL